MKYTYDALNHLKTMVQAAGTPEAVTWNYVYDAAGNLQSVTDPRGAFYTTKYVYDPANRLIEQDLPNGTPASNGGVAQIIYKNDAAGNTISVSDPRNSSWVTISQYNGLNQLVQRTDKGGGVAKFSYDETGT